MSNCTIPACRRPLRLDEAHRAACYGCEHRIRGWLTEIDRQWPLLQACLHRDTGPRTGTTGRAEAPAPVRLDVMSLIGPAPQGTVRGTTHEQTGPRPVLAVLQDWAEHIATQRPARWPAFRTPAGGVKYLDAHLAWACTRPWITDLHTELGQLVATIRRITHTQPRRNPIDTIPCACGAFGLVDPDWSAYIECSRCTRLYTPAEYRAHAAGYRIAAHIAAAKETNDDDPA